MDKHEHFKSLSKEFIQLAKFPEIDFGDDSGFGLVLGDIEMNVGYRASSDEVVVITFLNEFTEDDRDQLYRTLLERNFSIQDKGVGAFGVIPGENQVTFSTKQCFEGMQVRDFFEIISVAFDASASWLDYQNQSDLQASTDKSVMGIRI